MCAQKLHLDDVLLKTSNKKPPFSDEMQHNTAIRFDTVKISKDSIPTNNSTFKNNGIHGIFAATPRTDKYMPITGAGLLSKGKNAAIRQGSGSAANQTAGNGTALGGMRYISGKVADYSKSVSPDMQHERNENIGLRAMDSSTNALRHAESTVRKGITTLTKASAGPQATAATIHPAAVKAMSIQTVNKAARYTKQSAAITAKAASAAKRVAMGGSKTIAAAASNPIVLIVIAVIVVLLLFVFAILMSTPKTPKDTMGEDLYNEIQTYIEDKDKAIQKEFDGFEKKPEFKGIQKKNITKKTDIPASTSIDLMAAYLLAKHSYSLTPELAKSEIDDIHGKLYRIEHTVGIKGKKKTLSIKLTGVSLKEYFDRNIDTLLNPAQKRMFEWYQANTAAHFTGKAGTPFEDENYMSKVTQEFGVPGYFDNQPHRGMDFAYPSGTPVLSVLDGNVIEVNSHFSWGYNILVESANGAYRLRYAHLSAFKVSVGDTVKAGQVIGLVGSTGVSSGPHLHLEVESSGKLINPREILKEGN